MGVEETPEQETLRYKRWLNGLPAKGYCTEQLSIWTALSFFDKDETAQLAGVYDERWDYTDGPAFSGCIPEEEKEEEAWL